MIKQSYGDEGNAFTLHPFLSHEECQHWIARAEAIGFQQDTPISTAKGMVVNTHIRNNDRAMVDRPDWAQELWPRMREYFPSSPSATPIGLNERFRFYRYRRGHYFKPHLDGSFMRNATQRSLWTVLIYLNGDITGGQTALLQHNVEIHPQAGLLLAFTHRQPHCGRPVEAGIKYVLRTDLMYRLNLTP